MVSIKDVRASNESLKSLPQGLVAVFAGATAGIGLHSLKQLAKYTNAPRVYMIGRSKVKAKIILDELQVLNPKGTFIFHEGEFSLIKDVDRFSEEIKKAEQRVDILCMSPGYVSFVGREETSEGVECFLSVSYYSRLRLAMNLLPLLTTSASPRVVSIFAAGHEGALDSNDLELRTNYSFGRVSVAAPTMTNLAFEELAQQYPSVSFIHSFPGQVQTEIMHKALKTVPGVWYYPAQVLRLTVLSPMLKVFCMSADECGERHLFLATSARYPAAVVDEGKVAGLVPKPVGIEVAQATVVENGNGNGVYRTTDKGEVYPEKDVLENYRKEGLGKVVLEHTIAVCERARKGLES